MAAPELPPLGLRIRQERAKRGISLRSLARDVGISASMISQIETAKSQPSVSTLYAITSALGISIEDVFRQSADDPPSVAQPPSVDERPSADEPQEPPGIAAAVTRAGVPRLGPLVRPEQRKVLRLDSGVTWEQLGELPEQHVDFLRVTYAPGGTSSSTGELMRHSGSEYGYLLHGELVFTLAFQEVRLAAGDAISFDSTTPHGYRNDGAEPAVGVWFVMERCLPE